MMSEHRFHTPEGLDLEVNVPAGDVLVRTVEGDESVIVVEGDERLVEQTVVEMEGRTLLVSFRGKRPFGIVFAVGSFSFRNDRLRVSASVPHGTRARITTASADVRIDGRLGSLKATTASGDLTAHGAIDLDASIKTVSGDVRIDRVGGRLGCQTVSGDVEVRSVDGPVELRSVSGDVRIDTLRQGDARFTSVSGDIEIGIATGSFLDVDAGSVSGDLSSEVPLASAPSGDADEGPTVVLRGRTVSGDVRVRLAS